MDRRRSCGRRSRWWLASLAACAIATGGCSGYEGLLRLQDSLPSFERPSSGLIAVDDPASFVTDVDMEPLEDEWGDLGMIFVVEFGDRDRLAVRYWRGPEGGVVLSPHAILRVSDRSEFLMETEVAAILDPRYPDLATLWVAGRGERTGRRVRAAFRFGDACVLKVAGDGDPHHIVLEGSLGPGLARKLRDAARAHPELTTLVIKDSPGGSYDDSFLEAARTIRSLGWTTRVPSDGRAASLAAYVFAAGVDRVVEPGGRIGVHHYGGYDTRREDGLAFEESVRELLGDLLPDGAGFFDFTLRAAPSDEMHWMTDDEIDRWLIED
jgi:hypothetical protein